MTSPSHRHSLSQAPRSKRDTWRLHQLDVSEWQFPWTSGARSGWQEVLGPLLRQLATRQVELAEVRFYG